MVESPTRGSGRLRRTATAFFLLLCVIVSGVSLFYVPRLLRAASVLYALSGKRPPLTVLLYNHISGYNTDLQEQTIAGETGAINLRVYVPVGKKNPANIVIVHGFVPDGNRNTALNAFAVALTRRGFRVILPTLPAEQQIKIEKSDLRVIADTVLWTAKTGNGPVSLFGISFGGGLSITAAEQPDIKQHIRMVFSISGYNSLATIARWFTKEPVFEPSGRAYEGTVHPGTAMLFVRQYMDEMVPSADAPELSTVIERLAQTNKVPVPPGSPLLAPLTAKQQEMLFDMQDVQSAEVKERYAEVIQHHQAAMLEVSPASVLSRLDVPLYVLHGSKDNAIPSEEVLWMEAEVPPTSDSHFLISPWMQHVVAKNAVSLRERIKVGQFLADVLARAAS